MTKKRMHMVGIGGIGMSGLAILFRGMGWDVTGSDIEENDIIKKLKKKGIRVDVGHNAGYIKNRDIVVYSSSIPSGNPELLAARAKGLRIISRIELLKMIMDKNKITIGITGTHGKTTTTAMASVLALQAGLEPTVLVGGESSHFDGNAKLGKGKLLVAEVDESDGKLVCLDNLSHIIMTNLEKEHLEHYKDEAHLLNVFKKFLSAQSRKSTLIYRIEDANLNKLLKVFKGKMLSFGFSPEADIYAKNIKIEPFKIDFDCFYQKKKIGRFAIKIPGVHNVLNALAVISLGLSLGVNVSVIKRSLESYKGVKRRFEVAGEINGAKVVEDYAHHPTEIKATIAAAFSLRPKRLITVFQPHRYTRTNVFYREFATSFAGSSEVVLAEVYSASEEKIKGANAKSIYDIMKKDNTLPVRIMDMEKIPEYISRIASHGDLILILGAGDICKVARKIADGVKMETSQK